MHAFWNKPPPGTLNHEPGTDFFLLPHPASSLAPVNDAIVCSTKGAYKNKGPKAPSYSSTPDDGIPL